MQRTVLLLIITFSTAYCTVNKEPNKLNTPITYQLYNADKKQEKILTWTFYDSLIETATWSKNPLKKIENNIFEYNINHDSLEVHQFEILKTKFKINEMTNELIVLTNQNLNDSIILIR